ncbi:amino acid transporter, putative [Plasmodium sp. gorilla clade G2]|uniref:amino acid transporter, putative n=1 Tax=Plasmodium sp. gorilla clade G2 TaxID=880535 RepID=UPI000D226F22|nr:amino acid transporter, putative [Plasmodium sp. gorilla clade G2]SOV11697.1 amino acid transporter, putative [Plasmodium sp. gorilla clade G2]
MVRNTSIDNFYRSHKYRDSFEKSNKFYDAIQQNDLNNEVKEKENKIGDRKKTKRKNDSWFNNSFNKNNIIIDNDNHYKNIMNIKNRYDDDYCFRIYKNNNKIPNMDEYKYEKRYTSKDRKMSNFKNNRIKTYKNSYNNIINFIKENKNDMKKVRYFLFLRAYENSELFHIKKENKKEKHNLRKNNKCIDIKDAKERQRLKLLKILKSYHIKYEGYTDLYTLCNYSIYYEDKKLLDELLNKQNCNNFFYYLVSIGISYNDIIHMASVFENIEYLKYGNLYMLPWIYKKLNKFYNFDVTTFILHCIIYSISTLNSSLFLFIKYKTFVIILPLFITYLILSTPLVLQEINSGRFVLDGCISFFWSINNFHLPIGIILIISYILSIIKSIDFISLHLLYLSTFLLQNTPWIYKNIDSKICSKFNGSKNICDFSRNICYYNDQTNICEINKIKLGTKIYDMLLNRYIPPKSEKFQITVIVASFLSLFLYNAVSKYKTSHKFLKIFLFLLIVLFLMHILAVRDFTLFQFLLADFNFHKIGNIILNYEVWILCMLHCIVNLSIHSGLYFYTSKGLRLGINVVKSTYIITTSCFLVDMLIFVSFSNIIGKYIKDINRNYSFLLKLIKKNIFYILIPVGNNIYNKFTLFLGIYVGIIFLTFLLLSASKRIDILFLSINDMYPLNSKKHIAIAWILIFFIYMNYRFLDNELRYMLSQYVYQLITLLILFYINFNFFWLSGIKETVNKLGLQPLICKFVFTFISEFSLIYLEIVCNVKYRIFFFFLRQFINILIIPVFSILICTYISNIRKKKKAKVGKGIKYILQNSYSLAIEYTSKNKNIQLEYIQKMKYTKWFNIYIIFFFKYIGLDIILMCIMYVGNKLCSQNEIYFKKRNINILLSHYFLFIIFLLYVYIAYINIPLLHIIKKKLFFKANNFNVLDYPLSFEKINHQKKNSLFSEFINM